MLYRRLHSYSYSYYLFSYSSSVLHCIWIKSYRLYSSRYVCDDRRCARGGGSGHLHRSCWEGGEFHSFQIETSELQLDQNFCMAIYILLGHFAGFLYFKFQTIIWTWKSLIPGWQLLVFKISKLFGNFHFAPPFCFTGLLFYFTFGTIIWP